MKLYDYRNAIEEKNENCFEQMRCLPEWRFCAHSFTYSNGIFKNRFIFRQYFIIDMSIPIPIHFFFFTKSISNKSMLGVLTNTESIKVSNLIQIGSSMGNKYTECRRNLINIQLFHVSWCRARQLLFEIQPLLQFNFMILNKR